MARFTAFLLGLSLVVPAWAQTRSPSSTQLTGGGELSIRRAADSLHVVVKGPRAGLASLCVGDDSRVRILHASAAVGEALYEREGGQWLLKSGFEWKLRDDPKTAGPAKAEVREYLSTMGWVANASAAGNPQREFTIHVNDRVRFLGVTFHSTGEPLAMSYWPESIDDDCRQMTIAQGSLPEVARFRPSSWHPIGRRD